MLNYPKYSHDNYKSISHYLTIIVPNDANIIEFNDTKIQLFKGNILLLRENIHYSLTSPDFDIFDYPKSFFDHLFYSQVSDCRIIYDFLNIEIPNQEYLFFNTDSNSNAYQSTFQIKNIFMIQDSYQDKLLRLSLVATLTYLQRNHHSTLDLSHSSMNRQHKFGQILGYMGENYSTITLTQLATHFNYNPDYLSAYFKKVTGHTFSEKLLEIRIEQAKRYLLNSELKVEDIIVQVGFTDKSFFTKKFKLATGYTPLQYRKKFSTKKNDVR